jgi:hypothetical protein
MIVQYKMIVNELIFALDRLICVGNKKKKKMTFNAHALFFDRYSLAFFLSFKMVSYMRVITGKKMI